MWIAPPLTKERLQTLCFRLVNTTKAHNCINPARLVEIETANKEEPERALAMLAETLKNLRHIIILRRRNV